MKLRRALTAAAATAVIAPAALLVAPAAYAEEGTATPTPGSSETETRTPAPSEPGTASPSESETTTSPSPSEPGTTSPSPSQPGTTSPSPSGSGTTSPSPSEPGTASPSPSESTPDEEPPVCEADFEASLSGLPDKIVAGSGWKEFHLNLDNSRGEELGQVFIGATVLYEKDADGSFESDLTSKYATFQYFDGRTWTGDLSDGGIIGDFLPVDAGKKISLKLRLSISASAPAGSAVAIAFGLSGDEEDCGYDEEWYRFEILAPGRKPGHVGDAKPQDGKSPVDVRPQGGVKDLKGRLAETGSSSALPMVALTGGAAVVLGAGAVFVVRRRRGAGADTSATA